MRIPLYVCPEFRIECEFNRRGMLFLHNDVYRYSPRIRRELERAFKSVCSSLRKAGVKKLFTLVKDEKTIKYNEMFGFRPTGIVEKRIGAELRMLELKDQP